MSTIALADERIATPAAKNCAFRIAVIIVNYKTAGMLADSVRSLLPELRVGGERPWHRRPADDRPKADAGNGLRAVMGETPMPREGRRDHLFVIDNASGGDEAAKLDAVRDMGGVTVIESAANLGFAGGNNLAIERIRREGGAEFYLLLNPDTVARAGAIETLVEFLEGHPEAACVGPRLEDWDGTAQQSAFGDVTPLSELVRGASIGPLSRMLKRWAVYGENRVEAHETDWLAGACVLMRREMLETTGLLDDQFFMYFEEVDFFRRARKLGLRAWHEPAARVVHLVGKSSGINVLPGQKRLPAYWFESRHWYFRKHFGYAGMLAADALWLAGHFLDRVRKLLTGVSHAAAAKRETRDLLRHSLRQMLHPFAGESDDGTGGT